MGKRGFADSSIVTYVRALLCQVRDGRVRPVRGYVVGPAFRETTVQGRCLGSHNQHPGLLPFGTLREARQHIQDGVAAGKWRPADVHIYALTFVEYG